jgi:hypothetical protein
MPQDVNSPWCFASISLTDLPLAVALALESEAVRALCYGLTDTGMLTGAFAAICDPGFTA